MPQPEYTLSTAGVRLPDGRHIAVPLKLPGDVNRGNALFAIATANLFDVPADVAAARLAEVDDVDGRYARLDLGGRPATLFLAKNPAGWAAALSMIEEDSVLAVGINARIADGTDTSWLYDVPFERLAGRVVGATRRPPHRPRRPAALRRRDAARGRRSRAARREAAAGSAGRRRQLHRLPGDAPLCQPLTPCCSSCTSTRTCSARTGTPATPSCSTSERAAGHRRRDHRRPPG